jgi:hypothetical protein
MGCSSLTHQAKRPPADEMVLVMAGYDVNEDQRNELYAFNGLPNYYMNHPIPYLPKSANSAVCAEYD